MSTAFDDEPPPSNTNNPTGTRVSSWQDERQRVTSFADMGDDSMPEFLTTIGYLFGVRVDCNSGPKRTTSRVAVPKAGGRTCLHDGTELDMESIATHNEREANYARRGWTLRALSLDLPWIRSRIANNNQSNRQEDSVTKRVLGCLLHVDIPLDDLSPAPEFDTAVRDALARPTRFEKFRAIYGVFDRWGDVIPLSFDVGTSLTAADSKSNHNANPIQLSNLEPSKLIDHKTAKILIQGIDLTSPSTGDRSWIYGSKVPIGRWSQVRVTKAVPITYLLSAELQEQLKRLYNSLLTYHPLALEGDVDNCSAFDDTPHALKVIRSVTIYCTEHVRSLCVTYSDGSASGRHGSKTGSESTFHLDAGEHIAEVHTWRDSHGVSSIQFFTTTGRASQAYGGGAGAPTILNGEGGLLTAFCGRVKNDLIYQLQGIWRHDIQSTEPNVKRKYSQYHGDDWGHRFSDLPLLKDSRTTISKIKIHCGDGVDAIQVTYTHQEGDRVASIEGPHRGGTGGGGHVFDLEPGEYITTVRGGIRGNVRHLCFGTNKGRTSPIYGRPEGNKFVCQAPLAEDGKAMRLHSICGRCGGMVDGLLCVWAAV